MDWTETLPPWGMLTAVVLAVLLILVLALLLRRRRGDSFPYRRRPAVLTPEEHSLFSALEHTVGDRVLLLTKPRVAEVLELRKGLRKRHAARAREPISMYSFDFVLCAPADSMPLVAVELLAANESAADRARDRFLDEACNAAGLGLLRIPQSDSYTEDLIEKLRPYLERSQPTRGGELTPDGRREPILDLPTE